MDRTALLKFAEAQVDYAWARFLKIYPALKNYAKPKVVINARLKSTAGRCFYESNRVDFSASLLAEFLPEFAADTIPHEVAHQVAFNLFDDRGHGKPWKSVMIAYGIKPDRCHNYFDLRICRQEAKK